MVIKPAVSTPTPLMTGVRSPHLLESAAPAPSTEDQVQLASTSSATPPAALVSSAATEAPAQASLSQRVALAGLTALSLVGGLLGSTSALAAKEAYYPPATSVSQPAKAPVSAQQGAVQVSYDAQQIGYTRTYINDMIENNQLSGKSLNTYGEVYQNNYNTLARIEREIVTHPQTTADPAVRRVYQKIRAALDSLQITTYTEESVTYRAATQTIQMPDGTTITMPMEPVVRDARTKANYAGAATMTDHTIEQIQDIMRGKR